MVPHVVLPESIEYHRVSKNLRRPNFDLDRAGDFGMVSPYVASYTAFPSYQVPLATGMKSVNQSVYPVSPQPLPLPAKEKTPNQPRQEEESFELVGNATEEEVTTPIRLASADEEIVQAVPLSSWENNIEQTGIFCQKPAKPPAAWSFTSPIFKAASVPMGWGPAGHTGYINQYGPRGCTTQIGFQPMGGAPMGGMDPQNGMMMQPGMMQPPMQTFQMGRMNGGLQTYQLPNGMTLLSLPPDHSRCGVFRCRCGNTPRMMLLPPGPAGMAPQAPMNGPEAMMMPGMMGGMNMMAGMPGMMGATPFRPVGMGGMGGGMMHPMMMQNPMMMQQAMMQQQMMQQAMMQQAMMQQMMQPQIQMMPMSVMTPYGPMFAGYQAVPVMNPMAGMMPMQQKMQAQALQNASDSGSEGKEEASQELKAPMPLGGQCLQGGMAFPGGMFANPYGMYAAQADAAAGAAGADQNAAGDAANAQGQAQAGMMNPMMMCNPMMMQGMQNMQMGGMQNPMMFSMNPCAGTCMTPYGMMAMNPMMGYGMMNVGMQNDYGMGGGQAASMGRGDQATVSDLIQVMMLMNVMNKQEPRKGPIRRLLSRFRERRNAPEHDPFQQLMQAWTTPYYQPDTAVRMPSRNAYPYGYFGAQPGAVDTANYGGFYNLYMGNTSYPGLY